MFDMEFISKGTGTRHFLFVMMQEEFTAILKERRGATVKIETSNPAHISTASRGNTENVDGKACS